MKNLLSFLFIVLTTIIFTGCNEESLIVDQPVIEVPLITEISKDYGYYNDEIELKLENYNDTIDSIFLSINNYSAEILEYSNNKVRFKVPINSRTGKIKLKLNNFMISSKNDFIVKHYDFSKLYFFQGGQFPIGPTNLSSLTYDITENKFIKTDHLRTNKTYQHHKSYYIKHNSNTGSFIVYDSYTSTSNGLLIFNINTNSRVYNNFPDLRYAPGLDGYGRYNGFFINKNKGKEFALISARDNGNRKDYIAEIGNNGSIYSSYGVFWNLENLDFNITYDQFVEFNSTKNSIMFFSFENYGLNLNLYNVDTKDLTKHFIDGLDKNGIGMRNAAYDYRNEIIYFTRSNNNKIYILDLSTYILNELKTTGETYTYNNNLIENLSSVIDYKTNQLILFDLRYMLDLETHEIRKIHRDIDSYYPNQSSFVSVE
uniref:hypothetical protein n=1 Tax=uncultured Polaribacter sp. TaxID=174711 RepID=UPI0026191210|nr:hypothetical protein [uncultured Polaribacter sp.]